LKNTIKMDHSIIFDFSTGFDEVKVKMLDDITRTFYEIKDPY